MNYQVAANDRVAVAFERFGPEEYAMFLRCKKLPEYRLEFDAEAGTYVIDTPARFASLLGIEVKARTGRELPLAGHLWDYQAWIVRAALSARRYAIWADCGQGKTPMGLEWLRQAQALTGKRVLLFAPLNIVGQWMEEAEKFYLNRQDAKGAKEYAEERMAGTWEGWPGIVRLETREEMVEWCKAPVDYDYEHDARRTTHEGDGGSRCGDRRSALIGICNYEKMIPGVMDELRLLGAVALDESSILKTGGGTIKWNLIKSCRGIEYKLSLTATPAPNDAMEYASQAAFLEVLRHEGEILWTYFTKDKTGAWRVKPHAKEAFYRFMCGWSVYLRHPEAYGFVEGCERPPEPVMEEIAIEATREQAELAHGLTAAATGDMLANERLGIRERSQLSQIAKGFLYEGKGGARTARRVASLKPEVVAARALGDMRDGLSVLIWTVFDEEAEILRELMGDAAEYLNGATPERERVGIIERFRHGECRCLVSKARMLGYGLNFHHVGSMIFSGWDDSFEAFYQALRRAWRRGQTRRLRVWLPVIEELEGAQLRNVQAKAARFDEETALQERLYAAAMRELRAA